jgi:hypothetical protein
MPTTVDPAVTPERGLGDALAAAGGLVLFVSLFIVWYGIGFKEDVEDDFREAVEGEGGGVLDFDVDALLNLTLKAFDRSAWEAFKFLDIVLAVLALAAVALVMARLLRRAPDLPLSPGLLIAALGGLALLIVLIRLLFTPNLEIDLSLAGEEGTAKAKDTPGVEVDRHFWGPFFGVLGSLAMIVGGLLAAGGRSAVDAVRAGEVRGERPLPPIEPEPAAPEGAPLEPVPEEGDEEGGEDRPRDRS